MVTKDKYSLDPAAWCGLNRPDMLRANTLQSTPCTERLEWFDTFNVVDAGRKLITEAWGNWAKQIGKLQSK